MEGIFKEFLDVRVFNFLTNLWGTSEKFMNDFIDFLIKSIEQSFKKMSEESQNVKFFRSCVDNFLNKSLKEFLKKIFENFPNKAIEDFFTYSESPGATWA